ncbi:MAG: aminotransferase class V-fold PLP-dependent enzyme [Acidobacteriota bacterium]
MTIPTAIAALGSSPFTEANLRAHIFPLFSKTLASPTIYLENHSLGRPLDQTEDDLRLAAQLWQTKIGGAWEDWNAAEHDHRANIATLIGSPRPDTVVPKVSAGQGLRSVLNAHSGIPHVIATTAEFDSIDVILKQYAAAGRITLSLIPIHDASGNIDLSALYESIAAEKPTLVCAPHVLFMTSQILPDIAALIAHTHAHGARFLLDAYHSIGVFPVDIAQLNADFLVGGSYKYLRGGPGAAFLYLSPSALESNLHQLDIGWFAKANVFGFDRSNPPILATGGNAWLESTPAPFTYYQAKAGQQLALALGIDRIRTYTLDRLTRLKNYLADAGIAVYGATENHGAFLTLPHPEAAQLCAALREQNIATDARPQTLRLGPDLLTTDADLKTTATVLATLLTRNS